MAANATFNFENTRKIFQNAISESLSAESNLMLSILQSTYQDVQMGETDKKIVFDQAFRDIFLCGASEFSTLTFEKLLQLSFDSAVAQICSPTLPVVLLTDAFEILSLGKCEEIFYMVEMKVSVWKQDLFFNQCKNSLLRLCNDLLRRLSRSQNTVFCGRILLFLAKFFPFSERSGLNVVSEFNLDNLTAFGVKDENNGALDTSGSDKDKEEMEVDQNFQADYNLYKKFWSLQDFFRNPNQCYTKTPWTTFCSHTNDVLSAFSTIKLDERRNRSKWEEGDMEVADVDGNSTGSVQQYFAKYLTSQNLLELQLGDSNFRRYILLQFLIMFQYLDSPVKFKQETQKLSEDQTAWMTEATEQVYRLLGDTPPDGASFSRAIRHILKREELWSNWKNEGCPEFRPSISLRPDEPPKDGANGEKKTAVVVGRPRLRGKRQLGDQIREAAKRNKCIIGNVEMNRLWNLNPDNMAACRSKERDFLPTLENYFEEAIEQLDPSVEAQYKRVNEANFGWRALRLLSRRSSHFFTHGNTPITRLPDYLETHVKKLAKDMQSTVMFVNVKAEPVDDAPEVEQMEPETDPVSTAAEMDGAPEDKADEVEEPGDEETSESKKPVLCTLEQLSRLGQRLGASWKILAPKLGFGPDEVEYFETEVDEVELQAKKMFQLWIENEGDAATPENLLYTLEGLSLLDSAKDIF
nr:EOG090X0324 [Eurycercus lamellatus]